MQRSRSVLAGQIRFPRMCRYSEKSAEGLTSAGGNALHRRVFDGFCLFCMLTWSSAPIIAARARLSFIVGKQTNNMKKRKRKLTATEKREKKRRRSEYMTIFVNGKQKRVKRPPTIDGMDVEEFIRRNADPIWLLQNGMYEALHQWETEQEENTQGEEQ